MAFSIRLTDEEKQLADSYAKLHAMSVGEAFKQALFEKIEDEYDVAVADEAQLAKIIKEIKGVIDEKDLRTWNSEDVLGVHDALVRAHESINKLALVPESF